MDAREIIGSICVGAAGGLLAGVGVAVFAARVLDQKMAEGSTTLAERMGAGREELEDALAAGRRELEREVATRVRAEVPPVVRAEVEATLGRYGLTPAVGRQVAQVVAYAEGAGLLGIGTSRYAMRRA